ncbi:hypothetical protein GP486_001657 [Trichoglossum hirsutum]|uniref:PH domain-containing protein n=1 Tax=Trichoglossum hirsutum TaxID=265104 RepID=A0A9P8LGQ4_9PEZI|nr:hypothetical protein GP486_001657 [Trichoglossum hirsutum]
MSGTPAKFPAKKNLSETTRDPLRQEDPQFETIPATCLKGKHQKVGKKELEAVPPGISLHDAKVLRKVKRRAHHLDSALFSFLGVRFGWSSVIGIVPVIGDVLDMFMALTVIDACKTIEGGLNSRILIKMYLNIVFDLAIGLVPFLGDIADAMYKCNSRNAILLEKLLRKRGLLALEQHRARMKDDKVLQLRNPTRGHRTQEPVPVKVLPKTRRGNLFGFGGGGQDREPDIEMGNMRVKSLGGEVP